MKLVKSWIVSILLGLYFISLTGPANAFYPKVGFSVEVEHQHSEGHSDHVHSAGELHHHSHSSGSPTGKQNDSEDTHCHKICVSVCAPILMNQNRFTLVSLEAKVHLALEQDERFSSNEMGSIFRPPIIS